MKSEPEHHFNIETEEHEAFYKRAYKELIHLITALNPEEAEKAALILTENYFKEREELEGRYNLTEST